MINVVTIDDNKVDLDRINLILYQMKEVNLVRTFLNAYKAKDYLIKNRVDLIFSDIEIKNINGINLLTEIKRKSEVVFMSNYSEYAAKSFKASPLNYLLKPVLKEGVLNSIERYKERNLNQGEVVRFFFIKEKKSEYIKIYFDEINYIEANGDYLKIFYSDTEYETLLTLKKVLKLLPKNFSRTHRSYIINRSKIENFNTESIYINNQQIPISRAYRSQLRNTLLKS